MIDQQLGRLIVYGQTSLDQKDPEKLTMHTNNPYFHPVTKLPPTATPGFISWMCMMVRIINSAFNSFIRSDIAYERPVTFYLTIPSSTRLELGALRGPNTWTTSISTSRFLLKVSQANHTFRTYSAPGIGKYFHAL